MDDTYYSEQGKAMRVEAALQRCYREALASSAYDALEITDWHRGGLSDGAPCPTDMREFRVLGTGDLVREFRKEEEAAWAQWLETATSDQMLLVIKALAEAGSL